jgi:enhancer of polycomb-like protein
MLCHIILLKLTAISEVLSASTLEESNLFNNSVSFSHVKCYRQFIFFPLAFAMEQDIPDYDMDSEDEKWVQSQAKKMDLLPLKVLCCI